MRKIPEGALVQGRWGRTVRSEKEAMVRGLYCFAHEMHIGSKAKRGGEETFGVDST